MPATKIDGFHLRRATPEDIPAILSFIHELARYEHMEDQVTATEACLTATIFKDKKATVYMAEYNGNPVGYILFFYNYSTFIGKPGIYIEDIYITKEHRHKGFGREALRFMAQLARLENCCRLEWSCLDWNEPSLAFYKSLGASAMPEWITHRLDEKGIAALACL